MNKRIYSITISCMLIFSSTHSVALQNITQPSSPKKGLRHRVQALKSMVGAKLNRFYKGVRGSKDCSTQEIHAARALCLIMLMVVANYISVTRLMRIDRARALRAQAESEQRLQELIEQEERERQAQEVREAEEQEAREHRQQLALAAQAERCRQEERERESAKNSQRARLAQMQRERQARLAQYAPEKIDTSPHCVSCKEPSIRAIPCDNDHTEPLCYPCLIKIVNIAHLDPLFLRIRIHKPCPLCKGPLSIESYLTDPASFEYQYDENSMRFIIENLRIGNPCFLARFRLT